MNDIIIEARDLCKEFDDEVVVNYINFIITEGEFVTLLGPSGCGKTTILRMIAGFEDPTYGDIFFYGKKLTELPAYERPVNTVFQNYALFPHMNVYENIAFPLRIKKMDEKTIDEKVKYYLNVVNLKGYEKRNVDQLSGGQQQRVAIARALANEPKILLLDEPLGALDLKLRKDMQKELKRIQQAVGITFIYVTHDQEEALSLSDKIIVMRKGEIQQVGSPTDIYNEPINTYVADFIGESNIIDAVMKENYKVEFMGKSFECVDERFPESDKVKIVIRPEDIDPVEKGTSKIDALVTSVTFKGVHYEILAEHEGFTFMIHTTEKREEGETIGLSFGPDDIHVMRAEQRNILDAVMPEDNVIEFLGARFECLHEKSEDDSYIKAVIKPADWIISKDIKNAKLTAKVTIVSYHSERYEFLAEANGVKIMLESPDAVKIGDIISLDVDKDDIDIMR